MVKYSSILTLSLFAFACGSSDPGASDAESSTGGTSASAGTSASGATSAGAGGAAPISGTTGLGGQVLTFGGQHAAGSAGTPSGEVGEETVESLRKASCAGWSAEPEMLPAVLELVVDVSLSMDQETAATKGRSKWEVTRDALGKAVADLPASTGVGMLYYPNRGTSSSQSALEVSECVKVDAMLEMSLLGSAGSDQRTKIADSLRTTKPNGATPTHDAFHYALLNGLETTRLPGNRFMLLITDGAPTLAQNCIGRGRPEYPSPTQPILDEVAAARQRGVRTFIIGSPGSEVSVNGGDARPWMSRAAELGGTARESCSSEGPNFCHIDLTQAEDFGSALNAALASVAGQVVSCDYQLPEPPAGQELDLAKINVIFTPGEGEAELIGRSTAADCTDGYRIDGNNEVVLCKNTCSKVQADATASLEVLFGCVSAPVKVK
jgi:hypothetical protein